MSEAPSIVKRAGLRYMLTRIIAICGQRTQTLCSASWQFNELKAFLTSTKITASVLSSSNMHRILSTHASIAVSDPDCNPVAVWRGPAAICIFFSVPNKWIYPQFCAKPLHTSIRIDQDFYPEGSVHMIHKLPMLKGLMSQLLIFQPK